MLLWLSGSALGFEKLSVAMEPGTREAPPEMAADGPRGWAAILSAEGNSRRSQSWVHAEIEAYRNGPWIDAEIFRAFRSSGCTTCYSRRLLSRFQRMCWACSSSRAALLAEFASSLRNRSALRKWVLLICLPLGAFVEAAAGDCYWHGLADRRIWAIGSSLQGVSLCILPLGYLAWLALLADQLPRWVVAPVSSAGRMALTVYLLESVIATGLSYHWGLRWFGRVGSQNQVLLAVLLWGGLVLSVQLGVYVRLLRAGADGKALAARLEYGRSR